MPTRKEKDIRTIGKTKSGSYYITIPIDVIRELKWKSKQKVRVKKHRGGILISDWKPSK